MKKKLEHPPPIESIRRLHIDIMLHVGKNAGPTEP